MEFQLNNNKEGVGYDNCPSCDTEQDHKSKFGGNDGKADYHFWSMYHCDDCGTNWSRTTEQGRQRNESKGLDSRWLTGSAALGRSYHTGLGEAWERIFGQKS